MTSTVHLLAMSGSLRAASSNTTLLRAAEKLAPEGVVIEHYEGLGALPHFNPDLTHAPPVPVLDLFDRVRRANGLLICCPEYARGIPGSFKNALDWLVGDSSFPEKPIALFNASARASAAQEALRLVLTTMSGLIIEDACITVELLSRRLDVDGIVTNSDVAVAVREALSRFANAIRAH